MVAHDEILHVELEEMACAGWGHALLAALSHSNGSASYRFAARTGSGAQRPYERASDAFPVMRLQGLDDAEAGPNTWVDTARHCLAELESQLRREGWARAVGRESPRWRRTYTRPSEARRGGWPTALRPPVCHWFCGNPRLMPPWLGSSQRVVTTLPRVKKCTPSAPCAWVSPNSELFQPPKE